MTVVNPCGWLQNAGATHTAEQMRNFVYASEGVLNLASLVPKGGVAPDKGSRLAVTQTGSPSMAVLVGSGTAEIPGTESSKQGAYGVLNDADFTISITAAHATLPRIDIIVFKIQDSQYSGGVNTSSLVVVDGTPAGSPSPPTAPANSITLAHVAVAAAASSIVNANITDKRLFLSLGIFPVTVTGDLPTFGVDGRYRDRLDINTLERDSGAAWQTVADPTVFTSTSSWVPVWTTSGTAPTLGNGTLVGDQKIIGKMVYTYIRLTWGSTTAGGTGTWIFTLPANQTSGTDVIKGFVNDNSATLTHPAIGLLSSNTVARTAAHTNAGVIASITATHPFTWAVNDILLLSGQYQTT